MSEIPSVAERRDRVDGPPLVPPFRSVELRNFSIAQPKKQDSPLFPPRTKSQVGRFRESRFFAPSVRDPPYVANHYSTTFRTAHTEHLEAFACGRHTVANKSFRTEWEIATVGAVAVIGVRNSVWAFTFLRDET